MKPEPELFTELSAIRRQRLHSKINKVSRITGSNRLQVNMCCLLAFESSDVELACSSFGCSSVATSGPKTSSAFAFSANGSAFSTAAAFLRVAFLAGAFAFLEC